MERGSEIYGLVHVLVSLFHPVPSPHPLSKRHTALYFFILLISMSICFPTECMTMVIICTGCYIIIVPFVILQCYDTFLPNTVECLLTSWEPLTHEWIFTLNYGKAIPQKKTSPKSLEILTVYKELIWFHIYKYLNVFIWWQQSDKRCYVYFHYWFYYFSFHVNMWIHLWYLYSIFYKSLVAIFFYLFLIASLFSVFHIFFSWWL